MRRIALLLPSLPPSFFLWRYSPGGIRQRELPSFPPLCGLRKRVGPSLRPSLLPPRHKNVRFADDDDVKGETAAAFM